MPQRPDGKTGTERVAFTRPAAERIAKAVRKIEAGDREAAGLVFDRRFIAASSKTLRICTFTNQWNTATTNTLTFFNVTTTPNTVTAYNLHMPVQVASSQTAECAIGKAGTAWYLVSVNLTKLAGYDTAVIQLFGHSTASGNPMQWYSITTCGTATSSP